MTLILQWVREHGVMAVLLALGISQIASTMPSPTLTGFTSSWGYKWVGIIHSLVAIPRIIITLFPQYAAVFGVNAAQREVQVTDKQSFAGSGAGPLDDPPLLSRKPTVKELEDILNVGGDAQNVEITPTGAVRVIPPEKK
jgi:hypothetical protein